MSRGHSQEGSRLALGLAAKAMGTSSKVTLGQVVGSEFAMERE